jgi:hypothetical protein
VLASSAMITFLIANFSLVCGYSCNRNAHVAVLVGATPGRLTRFRAATA